MKEIREILYAFDESVRSGKRAVLATVVQVVGSSYRRPGARMLIDEEGNITGAISGGCLEGDAMRKAMLCMHQRVRKLVTYDTTLEDEREFGIQLGCNGLVRILFEPLDGAGDDTMALLRGAADWETDVALVTLFCPDEMQPHRGTCLLYKRDEQRGFLNEEPLMKAVEQDANHCLKRGRSAFKNYPVPHAATAFIEFLEPAVKLVIAGAGNDAQPLAAAARHLGWRVSIVDGRATHATARRFPMAETIQVLSAEECAVALKPGRRTAYMLMTHNYNYDRAMLSGLVESECFYIGLLGPKAKRERMLEELCQDGQIITSAQQDRIFGPAGLDIGAETADEIALSIVTEIMATLQHRQGGALRAKNDFIHDRDAA